MGDAEGRGFGVRRSPPGDSRRPAQSGPLGGFWGDAEWIPCIDGKTRPVEPGTFPLAHGAPARVGRLRAYGNAICAPQAAEFVRAYMSVAP
jgi:DNA (cytosine-5)-methyltransferase 1